MLPPNSSKLTILSGALSVELDFLIGKTQDCPDFAHFSSETSLNGSLRPNTKKGCIEKYLAAAVKLNPILLCHG